MYSATASRLRPRRQPEVRRRSRGTVSDPTGAVVLSSSDDMMQAAGRLANVVLSAQAVRQQFELPQPDMARVIHDLGHQADDAEHCRRVGPTSPRFQPAVNKACRFVAETPRQVRDWLRNELDESGLLYAFDGEAAAEREQFARVQAWSVVHLADEACRLAGWLRPHERPVQPDLVFCPCGELAKYRKLERCGRCRRRELRNAA